MLSAGRESRGALRGLSLFGHAGGARRRQRLSRKVAVESEEL